MITTKLRMYLINNLKIFLKLIRPYQQYLPLARQNRNYLKIIN